MPIALAVLCPLTLAMVLLASGIAKLRAPDSLAGWRDLGVPDALRRDWLLKLHPWAELALGVALAVLGGWLGLLAALAAVGLLAVYTALIWRVLQKPEDASCACFGEPTAITRATLVRNLWLVGLAVVVAAVIWSTPPAGGALSAASAAGAWGWVLGAAIAAGTAIVVLRADVAVPAKADPPTGGETAAPAEELDYLRARTPAVPVTLADGSTQTLRELSAQRPVLLLAVSETCGACQPVLDQVGAWRELLPEVAVHLLLMTQPGDTGLTETGEPQSLHDPLGYVRDSIAEWPTPTAVLLGADGLLAGGPVSGTALIEGFVADIRSQLDDVREAASSEGA